MHRERSSVVLGCTRDRRAFVRAVWPLALVTACELSVMVAAILFVAHSRPTRAIGLGLALGILLLALVTLLGPLRSRHAVDGRALELRFGAGPKSLRATIELAAIVSCEPVSERLASTHALGAYLDAQRARLVAAFSGSGQVLLRLRKPLPISYGWGKQAVVRELLVNFDDPAPLLRQLEPPPAAEGAGTVTPLVPARAPSPSPSPSARVDGPDVVLVQQLARSFGPRRAVDGVDLRIGEGEVYGLLGCNGAGKTTTIRMLVGLLEPSGGTVRVLGKNIWEDPIDARRVVGYSPDSALLYDRLTGREFLDFLAQMHALPADVAGATIPQLLEEVGLAGDADRLCGNYSLGMKRRLSFAAARLHGPRFLVLDEPLSGLDPRSASKLKSRIRAVAQAGTAVLLSTHDLATAEELCHRIGVLHRGRLLAEGTAAALRHQTVASSLEEAFLSLTDEREATA